MKKYLKNMLNFALLMLSTTLVVSAFAELEALSFNEGVSTTSNMERLAKNTGGQLSITNNYYSSFLSV